MAKPKKEEVEAKQRSDKDVLNSFLQQRADEHFNFTEQKYFNVSSGSLILDSVLGKHLITPGLHRFVGVTSGGKTSEAMETLKNFLASVGGSKGVYISAEGRLNEEVKKRSRLTFVTDPTKWEVGTVFVFESNIYEAVAAFITMLVNNENGTQYGMILDSVDGLSLKGDIEKGYDESNKVAGGAAVASVLMKRIAIPLAKGGHLAIFISQVRSEVVLDPYAPKVVRQIVSTGGNALLHYSNLILQFEPRFKGDVITDDDTKAPSITNPSLGHWAKVTIKKSSNDKNNYVVRYPIKYDDDGGSHIWREKEIVDCMLLWGDLEKSGAWYNFSQDLVTAGIITEVEKFQGLDKVLKRISDDKALSDKLYKYLSENLSKAYSESESE